MIYTATDENFGSLISAGKPVVVDFWAEWCGPCRALAPALEDIAKEYEGKADVVKCNVDECEDVPAKYGIRNIPTLLYFKNGVLTGRSVGLVRKSDIASRLDENL